MAEIPEPVGALLDRALVAELTVIAADGRPVTHPLIPLWNGRKIYMTSAILFSRKLEHIKKNPRVAVSLTDPVGMDGLIDRATIQGDARVIEDDPHSTWEQVLPLWKQKEPEIETFLGKRVALPLFFERSIIEITPRRVFFWPSGDTSQPPSTTTVTLG